MTKQNQDDTILAPFFDAASTDTDFEGSFLAKIAQSGIDHMPAPVPIAAPSRPKRHFSWQGIWGGAAIGATLGCAALLGVWIGASTPDVIQSIGDTYFGTGDSYTTAFSSDFDRLLEETLS